MEMVRTEHDRKGMIPARCLELFNPTPQLNLENLKKHGERENLKNARQGENHNKRTDRKDFLSSHHRRGERDQERSREL